MKINKVQIRDFCNHVHSTIDFNTTTFFVGPNAAGKSAIRNAIEWSVLNSTRGMKDKSGNPIRKGEVNLIRLGQKKTEVILDLSSGKNVVQVTRSRTKKAQTLAVDVNSVPVPELPKVDTMALALVLDSKVAIGLDPAGRKAMFQKYLMPDSTNLISSHLVHEGLDDKTSQSLAAQIIKESLEVVHKNISDRRLDCDRALKEMLPIEAPHHFIALPSGAKVNLDGIVLAEVEAELKEVEVDGEKLITAKADYQNVTSLLKSGEEEIAEIKKQVDSISDQISKLDDHTKIESQLPEAEAKLAEDRKLESATHNAYGTLESIQDDYMKRLAVLNNQEGSACEICQKPLSDAEKKALIDSTVSDIEDCDVRIKEANKEKDLASVNVTLSNTHLVALNDKINSIKNNRMRLEAQLAPQQDSLSKKEFAFKKAGDHKFEPVSDDDIQELRTRQLDLRETIIKKNAYDTQLDHNKKQSVQKTDYTQKRDGWNNIATILHPKSGSMAALIQKPLDKLKEEINKIAEQLNFKFVLREDYEIEFNGIIHGFLSDSEQYRVGIMLQIAIAKVANTGILALDYADTLVGVERGRMMGLATSTLQSEFESILVFSATERSKTQIKESFEAVNYQNTTVYWVENGTVDKLV